MISRTGLLAVLLVLSLPLTALPTSNSSYTTSSDSGRLLGSSFGSAGNQTFDYIIVGGGTAGLVVATRLAEDASKSVAVIEAGSFYEIGNSNLSQIPLLGPVGSGKSPFDTSPLVDWQFVTEPQAVSTIRIRIPCICE